MTSWEQTFAGLRASYLAGLEAKAENLARALERGDWPGVDRLAHDLRGSGGTYGFPEISQQAQAAEEATPVRKGLLAEALLQEVRRTLGRRDGGEQTPPPRLERTRRGRVRRVLVVDDDHALLAAVGGVLTHAGHEVVGCTSASAALDAAQEAHWDACVLDIRLPDLGGVELLKRLRAMPTLDGAPILMLSAVGDERVVAAALDRGADDYVVKPFRPLELEARISRLLRRCTPTRTKGRWHGRFTRCELFELLQALSAGRPGRLEVQSEDGDGHLDLRGGKVVDARWEQEQGAAAARHILGLSRGRFGFTPGRDGDDALDLPVQALLLDAARALDEGTVCS